MTEKRIAWLKEQLKDAEFVHLGNWKDGAKWDVQGDLEELIEERTAAAEAREEGREAADQQWVDVLRQAIERNHAARLKEKGRCLKDR